MKIALAFSGGGVRATVFHLGVLARLAREDLLGKVKMISSVSGGSLAAGLVFARSGNRWPGSAEYLHDIVPQIHHLLTSRNLQRSFALKSIMFPWRLASGRAAVLGDELERQWQIGGNLADLPLSPRWIINATCYQTGKNWRFQRDVMGDYQTKYVQNPEFPLSHALASSAAVPGLIGPLIVKSKRYDWTEYREDDWKAIEPKYRKLHLWDGGVYDNLGVESLFKPGEGLRDGTDFLIVCDASRPLSGENQESRWTPGYLEASMRLVDVATDQVRSLRARMLMEYFKQNPGSGAYLRMGRKSSRLRENRHGDERILSDDEVRQASGMETTLRRLSHNEFSILFRHGYEVANNTLATHCDETLQSVNRSHVQFKAA
ncbi:patatin-like phospholipase family protein [Rubripirellula amarantea]|uniref:Patatin-like phospholipase n=1 Tax=Rubripirellula amarantea TaxID=2527999 RepID=A0A5C5WEX0_9BACT|nr:patatin-like phospholipase family protein [Rubripirellula amarantea]MDA8745146.1 patatin-like phospholipase family protein [Rubripirellula amarantea]TWT49294.1 Patatin-like phospholipase [Rubripirellula amarantea]